MAQFIPFRNVELILVSNPNIKLGVIHHRFENLLQGCKRVADQWRTKEANKDLFFISNDGQIEVDYKGKKIYV